MLTTILLIIIVLQWIKIFKQGVRINDLEASQDWEETDEACCYHISKEYCDKHPRTDGKCCQCEECSERFIKELTEQLK